MVSKKIKKKWEKYSYEELKCNKELQAKYAKDFGAPYFEDIERMYNPDVRHELPVFQPEFEQDEEFEIDNFRHTLLNEIWNQKTTRNFNKEFCGLSGMDRSIIMAKMTGYTFQQIGKVCKITALDARKHFIKAMQKIIILNRQKCSNCYYKVLDNKYKKCTIWKVNVKNDFYCWLHRIKKKE